MADPVIKIKRSAVAGKIPTPDQLPLGEVALNTYDGYLYASKNVGIGTTVVVINPFRVGAGTDNYNTYFTAGNVGIGSTLPTSKLDIVGDAIISGVVTATAFIGDGSGLTGLTGASANTYGNSSSVPQITVDSNGRITSISNVTISGGGGGGGSIGIQSGGTLIGIGVTIVDFIGVGITASISGTTGSITIPTTSRTTTRATATNNQTTFSGLSYTVGYVDVYLNGAKLDSTEYTATDGTTVVLTTGTSTDDILEFVTFDGLSIVDLNGIDNIVDDTTPQLGGDLDINGNSITGTGNVNITGIITATGNVNITGIITATEFSGDLNASIVTASNTFVGGGIDLSGLLKESVNITAGKLSDNTNIDLANGMVHLFTTTETTTSTPNIRYDASNSLDSKMSTGDSITLAIITTAAVAGYSAQLTIDSSAVTESWLGGSTPTTGGSSGFDVYTYNIIKTGSATFIVLANLVNFV